MRIFDASVPHMPPIFLAKRSQSMAQLMTTQRFTDKAILAIKPDEGRRIDVIDPTVAGLTLRVSDQGHRTWYFRYRLPDGRQPRLKLGTYPSTDIRCARDRAQEARRIVEGGHDPAEIARKAAAEARSAKIRTFDDLTQAYFRACEDGTWIPKGKRKKDKTIASERALYSRHIRQVNRPGFAGGSLG